MDSAVIQRERFFQPHRLCHLCQKLVELSKYALPQQRGSSFYRTILQSHHIGDDLIQSAAMGCHLCAIIITNLDDGTKADNEEANAAWRASRIHVRLRTEKSKFDLLIPRQKTTGTLDCIRSDVIKLEKPPPSRAHVAVYRFSKSTGSTAAISLFRKWLDICNADHKGCNMPSGGERPTRLLDLKASSNSNDVRLVYGADTGNEPYITLSYCWGAAKPILLEPGTYDEFFSHIKWRNLPKTMQDAVLVCRGLAVRYLWIDALCIIQGDNGDFQHEAARMESIYGRSLLTIAAADSKDSNGGCFRIRKNSLAHEVVCIQVDGVDKIFTNLRNSALPCITNGHLPGNCKLDTRAWVFQERMFSPRTLYFGNREVHWECREGIVCAYHQSFKRQGHGHLRNESLKKIYSKIQDITALSDCSLQGLRFIWADVFEAYSDTHLSHPEDRLSALAGIASLVEKRHRVSASFGLWLPFFLDALLWFHKPWEGSSKSYRLPAVPSWSWINIGARLSMAESRYKHNVFLKTLNTAVVEIYPPVTSFVQTSILSSRFKEPPAIMLRGRVASCRTLPFPEEGISWTLLPQQPGFKSVMAGAAAFEKSALKWFSRGARKPLSIHKWVTRCPAFYRLHASRSGKIAYNPDYQPAEVSNDLVCLLVKRNYEKRDVYQDGWYFTFSVTDFGLVLQPTGVKDQYQRIGLYSEMTECKEVGCTAGHLYLDAKRQNNHNFGEEGDAIRILESYMDMFPGACEPDRSVQVV